MLVILSPCFSGLLFVGLPCLAASKMSAPAAILNLYQWPDALALQGLDISWFASFRLCKLVSPISAAGP